MQTLKDSTACRTEVELESIAENCLEKLLLIFENEFDVVTYVNTKGKIIEINNRIEDLLGYKRAEVIGKYFTKLGVVSLTQLPKLVKLFVGTIRNGEAKGIVELELKHKSGKIVPVEVRTRFIKDKSGKVNGVVNIIRDITERKRAEQTLKISEEKYRLLFSNMTTGFAFCQMIFDESKKPVDFIYLEANDAFETLTGLKKGAVLGKRATEVTPTIKQDNPEIFKIYGRVALTGKSEHFEVYFKPLSIWLSISVYSPQQEYFAVVFENITEQKKNAKMLKEYSEGLEQTVAERTQALVDAQKRLLQSERMSAIGEMAGMVGHDLRNPLSGIKNAAYVLRKRQNSLNNKDDASDMLNIIDRAVEHANDIVADLLDYSREIRLQFEEISPKSLVNYVLLSVKIPNNIKIKQSTHEDLLIWVDAGKIERVFTNLIRNAFEAMPDGGMLEIDSRKNDENIEFTFTDSGSGMSEAVLARIFTPLFTTKAQGMGFGLAICKRIIEAHNGKILVESQINKGTKFTISLPINPQNLCNQALF